LFQSINIELLPFHAIRIRSPQAIFVPTLKVLGNAHAVDHLHWNTPVVTQFSLVENLGNEAVLVVFTFISVDVPLSIPSTDQLQVQNPQNAQLLLYCIDVSTPQGAVEESSTYFFVDII